MADNKILKPYKPNEKQVAFLNTLKRTGRGLTLAEASAEAGIDFKSGTINALVTKAIVYTKDVTFDCNIVRKDNGVVVGSIKKTVKAYYLTDYVYADEAEGVAEAVAEVNEVSGDKDAEVNEAVAEVNEVSGDKDAKAE